MTTLTLGRTVSAPPWAIPTSRGDCPDDEQEADANCFTLSPRSVEVLQTLNEIFNSLDAVGAEAALR